MKQMLTMVTKLAGTRDAMYRCECGHFHRARRDHVAAGKIVSCGCYRKSGTPQSTGRMKLTPEQRSAIARKASHAGHARAAEKRNAVASVSTGVLDPVIPVVVTT